MFQELFVVFADMGHRKLLIEGVKKSSLNTLFVKRRNIESLLTQAQCASRNITMRCPGVTAKIQPSQFM